MRFQSSIATAIPTAESTSEDEDAIAAQATNAWHGVVRRVRFLKAAEGFIVADLQPESDVPPVPEDIRHQMLGMLGRRDQQTVTVRGVSAWAANLKTAESAVGVSLEVRGAWVVTQYGLGFESTATTPTIPRALPALRSYLRSGALPHIGPRQTEAIVARFGLDLFRVLDNDWQALATVRGITPARADDIHAEWVRCRQWYDLVSFFNNHGVSERRARAISEALGVDTLEQRLRDNPYLMTTVDGIGFKIADAMAMRLGWDPHNPVRLRFLLSYRLDERANRDGATVVDADRWIQSTCSETGMTLDTIRAIAQSMAAPSATGDPVIMVRRTEPSPRLPSGLSVAPWRLANAERRIATRLAELLAQPPDAPDAAALNKLLNDPARSLDASQKEAVRQMVTSRVSVMTGGPGTGKTTSLRTACAWWQEQQRNIVLCCPTGRAAQRLAESTGLPASTMHRRLGAAPGTGSMEIGDVFVLDEASMIDTALMAWWLSRMPSAATLVLVGDADQLPSVGPGAVFGDIIRSNLVPVARLTQVHRTHEGAGINQIAAEIRAGRHPVFDRTDDAQFLPAADDADTAERILALVRSLRAQGVPPDDIMVLSAQKEGTAGVNDLNTRLREILNPAPPEVGTDADGNGDADDPDDEADQSRIERRGLCARFRTGDRVMQTKNDAGLEFYNGEMATVIDIDPNRMRVRKDDGTMLSLTMSAAVTIRMGFAQSVHKSQGGERPVVIVAVISRHAFTLSRKLIYTAFTRASRRLLVVGQASAMHRAIHAHADQPRDTGLVDEMQRAARSRNPHPANGRNQP